MHGGPCPCAAYLSVKPRGKRQGNPADSASETPTREPDRLTFKDTEPPKPAGYPAGSLFQGQTVCPRVGSPRSTFFPSAK